ncbi:HAMP domain-containing sensor histidine kinase [Pleomorphomonas sp. JP5]|uniref:sensor histidine kinase n=1 Tax=Pleomorphomonas sp. JP5 TaxID=2942998 RepID=UPI002043BA7D|nr:HAMP domain-containing sensor histidine kinase [Pleomorphomonas sp. JP5]MCM5558410.1 ATP-binding protein [Pleomorphomonas sp. JP5]
MGGNLNTRIIRAMIMLALAAFAVVYFGLMAYFFLIYDWLYPEAIYDESWRLGDTVTLGLLLGIGILTASAFGWRLARQIVEPLKSVGAAARKVAEGDFSARAASGAKRFGEAGDLVDDFNRMAEQLQRAQSELKYSNSAIAHELRTPLTILRGRLQGLLDGAFTPSPELYSRLIAHVDDLSAIVEELRTLALNNAGQLDLDCKRLDLAPAAEAALLSLDDQLNAAGITIARRFDSAVVNADPARLRQALVAVLDNCRRYAPKAQVLVETGISDGQAFFRCSDNGPGLSDENRARAFERFWRADDSRGRSRGGSGLGLSIVKAIAQAHGGDALILPSGQPGLAIEIRLPCPTATNPD